ncbi:hypothetical protein ACFPTR_01245 [Aliibacillus thermotolerans]|uniref:Hydrolase n=1 Tax=Aliibacillus thermotolerans TaxID=1834418 RepID=A0ABW0U2B7_9BACI|nr:hypothetical protein [Aliibacillus thermotolerans]MDA3129896.1 hypothetical protein [Aliibacillus thermotolerans]
MKKQKYYVNLHPLSMDAISTVKIPDPALIQYEIEATPEERDQLEFVLAETQKHDMELRNLFSFRHYDDVIADEDRNEFQSGLNQVFDMIYELGTPETKQQLREIGLLNDDSDINKY